MNISCNFSKVLQIFISSANLVSSIIRLVKTLRAREVGIEKTEKFN